MGFSAFADTMVHAPACGVGGDIALRSTATVSLEAVTKPRNVRIPAAKT
jgi:hypothetical protein